MLRRPAAATIPFWIACFAMQGVACAPTEHAVLVEARSAGDVGVLEVQAIDRRTGRVVASVGPRYVGRTKEQINGDDPIRIAIALDSEASIILHIRGCGGASCDGSPAYVATRCYEVNGVVRDDVLLFRLDPSADRDGDGFGLDATSTCFDPAPAPAGMRPCDFACADPALDCDGCVEGTSCTRAADDPTSTPPGASIHPGARELCRDGVDQDCDGSDLTACDNDRDGYDACGANPIAGTCDCDDFSAAVHPMAEEPCGSTIDTNCDGAFSQCDDDDDGVAACAFAASTSCDCNDADPAVHGANPIAGIVAAAEACDGHDNDCDGLVDEIAGCGGGDLDGDGVEACPASGSGPCDCNDCDPGIHPGSGTRAAGAELCGNGIDEDCSGADLPCAASDLDHDGQGAAAMGGGDCDDADPHVYTGAPELCGNGSSESCRGDACASPDDDRDGYAPPDDCRPDNASIAPWRGEAFEVVGTTGRVRVSTEPCDGVDNNCANGVDEVLSSPVTLADGRRLSEGTRGCVLVARDRSTGMLPPGTCSTDSCGIDYRTNPFHCGGCAIRCTQDSTPSSDRCEDFRCICGTDPSRAACAVGDTCCGPNALGEHGGCVDLAGDPYNCSTCGASCIGEDVARPLADRCVAGRCRCGANEPSRGGHICCEASDVDPATDARHCGACGRSCGANATCAAARCLCTEPFDNCDGTTTNGCETNLMTSVTSCGRCGNRCMRPNATPACVDGACRTGECNAGFGNCDGIDESGCETRLGTVANCRSCNDACTAPPNATPLCGIAGCSWTCNSGFHQCGSLCVANTDVNNCGITCGTACPPPASGPGEPTCDGVLCGFSCAAGYHGCSNACVSNMSVTTCGARCTACPTVLNGRPTCDGVSCDIVCDAGFHRCGNACVRNDDPATCGGRCTPCRIPVNGSSTCDGVTCGFVCGIGFHACGTSCASDTSTSACGASCTVCPTSGPNVTGATCSGGTCAYRCANGFADCNGSDGCETATANDPANCGGCGITCAVGETCVNQQCVCRSSRAGTGLGAFCAPGTECCVTGTPACRATCS